MTSIVAAAPPDLIALAWYQLGYRPNDSLVLVGLHGPRRRAGAVVRCDLPPVGAERVVLTSMAAPLVRSGAGSVVLLLCTDDACRQPRPRVVRAAGRVLPDLGLGLLDALAVGRDGYRSYDCAEPDCCPPQGRPLAEVLDSRVAAELILAGRSLVDGEAALVADVLPAQPDAVAAARPHPPPADPSDVLRDWRLALQARSGSDLRVAEQVERDEQVARLLPELARAMADGRLRDAVMLTLVPGADRLADAVLVGAGAAALESCLAATPDHELLERGVRLLAAAARLAPAGHRAGPLGALAWLAWWSGAGGRARLLVDRALADQPGHRLAVLVDGLLELAVPPPWAPCTDRHPDGMSGS